MNRSVVSRQYCTVNIVLANFSNPCQKRQMVLCIFYEREGSRATQMSRRASIQLYFLYSWIQTLIFIPVFQLLKLGNQFPGEDLKVEHFSQSSLSTNKNTNKIAKRILI